MSVSLSGTCVPPSSSLPSIRQLISTPEHQITAALKSLQALYCPLRLPTRIATPVLKRRHIPPASTPVPVDSGYASQDEDEDDDAAQEEAIDFLRADSFERTFASRWLTSLLSRVEEMYLCDETKSRIIDDAAFILSSFSDSANHDDEESLTRDFNFPTSLGNEVKVTLNDAPLSGTDHTDVGLQSWGASIVLSSMLCADPERFILHRGDQTRNMRIIELGAGTGLVSLTVAKLIPSIGLEGASIAATDYHPAVLENCRANVATSFPSASSTDTQIETSILDWSSPPANLCATADLLIASDVVYAPEHAAWLRDCAAHLLSPEGTFWLMATVRQTGKFEGISETVEAAFAPELCPKDEDERLFQILEKESIVKRRGIGRGDETGYSLYRIGWA